MDAEARWFFYVYEGKPRSGYPGPWGFRVASGVCPTREDAAREGGRYLAQYLMDGEHFLVIRKAPSRAPRGRSEK